MSKARLFLTLAVVLVCTLAFAAPAFAWTHGNFSATTDACAGCHVAHAAQAPNLLKAGPTQTQFCFLCHGDGGTSAPYDVKVGKTVVGGAVYSSTAGGFVSQLVGADGSGGTDTAVTSRHNVWGFSTESGAVDPADVADTFVPGSSGSIPTGFVCASCHDPHAGGATPTGGYIDGATGPNPRLLRKTISVSGETYTNLNVKFGVATVGTFTYSADGNPANAVDSGVYRVTEYYSGSTPWCGACHNKFKAPVDSGTSGYYGMYRHAFDVTLLDEDSDSLVYGNTAHNDLSTTPVEYDASGKGKVACLSCHRAHSTTATVAGWASRWPRSEGGTSDTSALLRMNNRGVCYNCHGAAQENTPDL